MSSYTDEPSQKERKKMDRDKVAKGLKLCVVTGDFCGECPYDGMESCIEKLHDDALALLKEQKTSNTGKDRLFQCEKCGYGFDDIFLTDEHNYDIEPNYCPNCGRLVKLNA